MMPQYPTPDEHDRRPTVVGLVLIITASTTFALAWTIYQAVAR